MLYPKIKIDQIPENDANTKILLKYGIFRKTVGTIPLFYVVFSTSITAVPMR